MIFVISLQQFLEKLNDRLSKHLLDDSVVGKMFEKSLGFVKILGFLFYEF